MYRFNGFTQKANHAMNLAIQCAEEMGHTYVGSEHILLGLLKEGSGVAAAVLRAVEVDASQPVSYTHLPFGFDPAGGSSALPVPGNRCPRPTTGYQFFLCISYCLSQCWRHIAAASE